jgi:signal transduction histidine kinase
MFSKVPERCTAAWRIAIWTTLAFAFGTALAFFIVYFVVEQGFRERSDAWLSGEAEVLAQVAESTPRDNLYDRIVEEVAELATQEVPGSRNSHGQRMNSVFFLQTNPNGGEPLWVGPGSKAPFLNAIQETHFLSGIPQSVYVPGWKSPYRVVARMSEHGNTLYLGLSDRDARHMLHRMMYRFLWVWGGMVMFGFLVSYLSARRTLLRVERISETVSKIGSDDLSTRLPEGRNSDEISRLARTFNRMLDRIRSSVNQLRTVTDSVAHDLKSPVTSIRGKLEIALSSSNGAWRDSVADAIEELDKMSQLLNTTLDLAEAEAGALRLNRTPVNFSEVLGQLLNLYQPAMAERRHALHASIQPEVMIEADLPLLNRALGNLFDNELTHLPEDCRIEISLRSHDGFAELVIADNGPGFPPGMAAHAFERFVKGQHSPGHGLGLAFVDAVVQAHGGKAHVADRPGGGAMITLSLPVSVLEKVEG